MTTTDQDNQNLVKATLHGTFWLYAATYSGKILVFISTVILARLLQQTDFGLAGYALIVISFLEVLSDLGIGSAVIYYRDDQKVLDTAFWLNLATGFALFALTWFVAPYAAVFFNDPRITAMTRFLGLSFPLTAVGNIHSALLRKNLTFKRKFVPDITKSFGKGVLSVVLALAGLGAWSLVIAQVFGTAVSVIALWWVSPWRPGFQFDREMARPLLGYGTNIVAVNGLGTFINQVDYLVVGRVLGAAALGVYTLAFRIPELLVKEFCANAGQVIFPAYAKIREDRAALSQGFLITMRYMSLITVPVALGLAAVSQPLVITFFTEKWAAAIPVLSAISIYTLIRSITFNIGDVYKAQGRPDILTRLSLVKAVMLAPALWWAAVVVGSITAVAWMQVVIAFLAGLLNLVVAARLLDTPLSRITRTFWPSLAAGTVMAVIVRALLSQLGDWPSIWQLVAGVAVGAVVYGAILWFWQREVILQAVVSLRAAFRSQAKSKGVVGA
ncbi:MAG: lipopolysaccharide biosynthesis protein [Anaerolineales bacterium]|nr:lipopolysaccharide biosynthesis protein [Anaerolineales bacterium]